MFAKQNLDPNYSINKESSYYLKQKRVNSSVSIKNNKQNDSNSHNISGNSISQINKQVKRLQNNENNFKKCSSSIKRLQQQQTKSVKPQSSKLSYRPPIKQISSSSVLIPNKHPNIQMVSSNSMIIQKLKENKQKLNENKQNLNEKNKKQNEYKQNVNRKKQKLKSNRTTNRQNYKPKFILKDFLQSNSSYQDQSMRQKELWASRQTQLLQQHNHIKKNHIKYSNYHTLDYQNSNSIDYQNNHTFDQQNNHTLEYQNNHALDYQNNHNHNTFVNSPVAQLSAYYRNNQNYSYQDNIVRIKEAIDSKSKRKVILQAKRQLQFKKSQMKKRQISINSHQSERSHSSIQQQNKKQVYNFERKKSPLTGLTKSPLTGNKKSNIKVVKPLSPINTESNNINYKLLYLQTKKQLEIRTAYFDQAIQLSKSILQGMIQVFNQKQDTQQEQQYMQKWYQNQCQSLLQAFQAYQYN